VLRALSKIRAERPGVRQRVAAAFHFLGKVASQLKAITPASIQVSLKPTNLFGHSAIRSESGDDTPQSKALCAS